MKIINILIKFIFFYITKDKKEDTLLMMVKRN